MHLSRIGRTGQVQKQHRNGGGKNMRQKRRTQLPPPATIAPGAKRKRQSRFHTSMPRPPTAWVVGRADSAESLGARPPPASLVSLDEERRDRFNGWDIGPHLENFTILKKVYRTR